MKTSNESIELTIDYQTSPGKIVPLHKYVQCFVPGRFLQLLRSKSVEYNEFESGVGAWKVLHGTWYCTSTKFTSMRFWIRSLSDPPVQTRCAIPSLCPRHVHVCGACMCAHVRVHTHVAQCIRGINVRLRKYYFDVNVQNILVNFDPHGKNLVHPIDGS